MFVWFASNRRSSKNNAIVESEKTAIVMSILLPHYIWLATGVKETLNLR
jgi:hypothetical protein